MPIDHRTTLPPYSEWLKGSWSKILNDRQVLTLTEYSNLWLILDNNRLHTLDVLATILESPKKAQRISKRKRFKLTRGDASLLVEDFREQAKKLRSLAGTYELIATALSMDINNFNEIVELDDVVKNRRCNPF